MIPRTFRQFGNQIVWPNHRVTDVLKQLNDKYVGYRTEGIVYKENPGWTCCPIYEIFYSYVENFSLDDSETEEPEESLYELYECGIEPNHVQ